MRKDYALKSLDALCRPLVVGMLALAVAVAVPAVTSAAEELSDQSITDKIEDELLFDPGVSPTGIDVSTADGIVTLEGTANNILAKDRAARIAETVKGVRSVVNRIQVEPAATRSDAEIRKDVETALLNDPATESYEVTAQVNDGVVELEGTVDSYQERMLAEKVVKAVRGVTGIANEIEISIDTERPDGEIENEIRQVLKWDRFVDHNLITVDVDDGAVDLSGIVGSAAEKRQARTEAWVAGVESVDASDLIVKMWARDEKLRGDKFALKSAEELREAINDALVYDPRVSSFEVQVETAGSTVTLRGTVDNLKAKRAAEDIARHTVGVTWVDNRLKVKTEAVVSDEKMESRIRDAFLRDPYVERFEITPSVVSGTAYLYGTLDSSFEKNKAEEIAEGVNGVVDVKNYLRVSEDTTYLYDPYVDENYFFDDGVTDRFARRSPAKTDEQLEEDIESELWWSPYVNADDINVTVDDGVATLTGTVDSWLERQSAAENAYEGGATLVDNDVEVDYDES